MSQRRLHSLAPGLLCAGLLWCTAAPALQITGADPLQPRTVSIAGASAHDGRLQLRPDDGRALTVDGWPAFLPQRFGPQRIDASRRLHPAGPDDQLRFTRPGDDRPWLIVGSGARRGSALLGHWELQLRGRLWSISDGGSDKALGLDPAQAQPVPVTAEGQRWCLYLLESRLPHPRPGIATEDEPRADWAGWRLDPGRTACPAR